MRDYCKFCLHAKHTDNCSRDLPNAKRHYDAGWLDGRQDFRAASENTAYMAGYLAGEIALEAAVNY